VRGCSEGSGPELNRSAPQQGGIAARALTTVAGASRFECSFEVGGIGAARRNRRRCGSWPTQNPQETCTPAGLNVCSIGGRWVHTRVEPSPGRVLVNPDGRATPAAAHGLSIAYRSSWESWPPVSRARFRCTRTLVSFHSREQDITVDCAMGSRFAGRELVQVEKSLFHIVESLPDRPSGM
jgi:hypothetical protein